MRTRVSVWWRRWKEVCEVTTREREAVEARVGAEEAKEEMVVLCLARAHLRMKARCKRSLVLVEIIKSQLSIQFTI